MDSLKSQWIWIIDLASNFRRHLLIAGIVILTMGIALSMHTSIIIAALIILIFAAFPLTSWLEERRLFSAYTSKHFVVTSFNMQWDLDDHTCSLAFIRQCQSDIVVLQEVTAETRTVINSFKDRFPYQYGDGHSHVMIISRYELQLIEYIKWPGKFTDRALHVTCSIQNCLIHLFAINLQVTRSWHETDLRDYQINLLSESTKNYKEAVMVIGDFNAATGSRTLRTIETKLNLKTSGTLLNYRPTWPAKAGLLGIKLDHFFTSGDLTVLSQQPGPKLESDHRPVTAVVYIK